MIRMARGTAELIPITSMAFQLIHPSQPADPRAAGMLPAIGGFPASDRPLFLAGYSELCRVDLTGEAGARNDRKSLTGAPGAEGRVLQWSCHKWSSEGRIVPRRTEPSLLNGALA